MLYVETTWDLDTGQHTHIYIWRFPKDQVKGQAALVYFPWLTYLRSCQIHYFFWPLSLMSCSFHLLMEPNGFRCRIFVRRGLTPFRRKEIITIADHTGFPGNGIQLLCFEWSPPWHFKTACWHHFCLKLLSRDFCPTNYPNHLFHLAGHCACQSVKQDINMSVGHVK